MRHAFVHKNFRELNFEKKVIFLCHVLLIVFLFTPWLSEDTDHSPLEFLMAFNYITWLIALIMFVISFLVVAYFIDRLIESERVKLPITENTFFYITAAQQLLLIIIAWSVLSAFGKTSIDYVDSSMRFGIFLAFVTQVTALVATFLNSQLDKQTQARSFFQHPDNQPQE